MLHRRAIVIIVLMVFPGDASWAQCNAQEFIASVTRCGTQVGTATAMQGTTLVTGARGLGEFPQNTGGAFVLERVGGQWQEVAILLASDGEHTDEFGFAVALDGNTIVVGAHQARPNGLLAAGAAYVFERRNGSWVETQKLVASNVAQNARFGRAVAVDGDTIVVGAPQASPLGFISGTVYIFERQGGSWVETAQLVGHDTATNHRIGWSVSASEGRVAAGAFGATPIAISSGAVYIFEKVRGAWMETAQIFPADGIEDHVFGMAIALEGNRLFSAATGDQDFGLPPSGAVYFYELSGFAWNFRQKIYAIDPQISRRFGESLDVSGSTLVVGEPSIAGANVGSGGFHVYREVEGDWRGTLRFIAPDGEEFSRLGRSVAVSGEWIVGGAPEAQLGQAFNCFIGNLWFIDMPLYARPYCFGVACPCGNDDPFAGCAGSAGSGARLAGCGSGSVAANDATFSAEGLPPGKTALLFRGRQTRPAGSPLTFGDGLRCASGEMRRLGIRFASPSGSATWGPGLAAPAAWLPGETLYLQAWYRDSTSSPCTTGANVTNAIEATFTP